MRSSSTGGTRRNSRPTRAFQCQPEASRRFRPDEGSRRGAILHAGRAAQLDAQSQSDDPQAETASELHQTARALFERALRLNPRSAQAFAGLGRAQFASGQLERARTSLATVQRLGEWDARLLLDRGRIEDAAGRPARARTFWSEVVRRGSDDESERAARLLAVQGQETRDNESDP